VSIKPTTNRIDDVNSVGTAVSQSVNDLEDDRWGSPNNQSTNTITISHN
jgi:hypothetical protein